MSKTFHIIKRQQSKNYKPNCENAKRLARDILKRKSFSEASLEMFKEGGFEIIIDNPAPPKHKSPSTIDLPHVFVRYDNHRKIWEGYWRWEDTIIGEIISLPTKKRVLEELIARAKIVHFNNL